MIRVSINLWSQTGAKPNEGMASAKEEAALKARAPEGDWAKEIEKVDQKLTEEDVRATFSEKFAASHRGHLNKTA